MTSPGPPPPHASLAGGGPSPYSTGGGGTVLEHRYGALLLSHLLTGDPVLELGSDATVVSVAFQAAATSAVDDFLVVGRGGDGSDRRAAIAVRSAPGLVPSDQRSVDLLASYLPILASRWDDIRSGHWRLGLASTPVTPVRQLGVLAGIASAAPDERAFRDAVASPGRTTREVRRRLASLDAVMQTAAHGVAVGEVASSELTWRFLYSLIVRELRLEPPDESDRIDMTARLRAATVHGTPAEADRLLTQIMRLAGSYAPAAAQVTEAMLRHDLVGSADLRRSSHHAVAWRKLDDLAAQLRERTPSRLTDPSQRLLTLERAAPRAELVDALRAAASTSGGAPSTLVISGDPDVGKSALTLRAVADACNAGATVTALSLRQLPMTPAETDVYLGAPLREVLAGTDVRPVRLLVIDGAEAALEGRDEVLAYLATAALKAGLGVAAVTRTDGARAVGAILRRAAAAASLADAEPAQHLVAGLTAAEVVETVKVFPVLNRLAHDQRGAWLLARPGLVDLLLRADAAGTLPDRPLSEADVFAVVWAELVRSGESLGVGGVTPDEREEALLAIARRIVGGDPSPGLPPAGALPSLRSDGLLMPAGPTVAWRPGDEFASDLVRDFALARLMRKEGYGGLRSAGAPRWALRAARLSCQAALSEAGENSEDVRRQQQAAFDQIAAEHGDRWSELTLEAMLPLGDALQRAWHALHLNANGDLATLIRLALQRYTDSGIGEPAALAPLVDVIHEHWSDLDGNRRGLQVPDLLLRWLRGLIAAGTGPDPLRGRVRDTLLGRVEGPRAHRDEFLTEALALLGPDIDGRVEQHLRSLATAAPEALAPAVESLLAPRSLSLLHSDLLAVLTEAYYVERREDDDSWTSGYGPFDDGVREHDRARTGLNSPHAAWYYGPFSALLASSPIVGLRTINRLLDHAADVRVGTLTRLDSEMDVERDDAPGPDLELPGIGERRCAGDDHVWRWFRGTGVGPYPCMSALLAVERFADELIALGIPLRRIAQLLLAECHNLAMPGLVVGILVRHLDLVTDELDAWLSRPEAWLLEVQRVATEGLLHIQGTDPEDVRGSEYRRYTLGEVAMHLMATAIARGDEERVAALHECGRTLMRRARSAVLGVDPDDDTRDHDIEYLTIAASWAATLDPGSYSEGEFPDGTSGLGFRPPARLVAALEPREADVARASEAQRLLGLYAGTEKREVSSETIRDDLALARSLADSPPRRGFDPEVAPAAVAASAVLAHRRGTVALDAEELRWAAELLTTCAVHPRIWESDFAQSVHGFGADRSAAAALPALLMLSAGAEPGSPPHEQIAEALLASATSTFDEVRRITAMALSQVWDADCVPAGRGDRCLHDIALGAVEAGIRDCRLGPWGSDGRRGRVPITGPLPEELDTVATDCVVLSHLTAPIIAAGAASASECCVRGRARDLLDGLLRVHARVAILWAAKRYLGHVRDHHFYPAEVLFSHAARGDSAPLVRHLKAYAGHAAVLRQLLRDLSELATYDATLRASLPTVWPLVLTTVLDAIDAGADPRGDNFHSGDALANMLPHPVPNNGDPDPVASIATAETSWIDPAALSDLVVRWIPLGRGSPPCVDSAIALARTGAPAWQAAVGLRWVDDLVGGAFERIAWRCWFLPSWLEELRSAGHLDAAGHTVVRRLVDGLAAHGDERAVALQHAEE